MVRLYAVRHGQTEWNVQNKVCGRTDIPLTEQGIAQAEALAEKAKELDIDVIVSSPMIRARRMSDIVSKACNAPIIEDARLIETNFGEYEGIDRYDPKFREQKRQFARKYPGGESMFQVAHRVYGLLEDVKARYDGKSVLLVCHGGVCRIIRTYFEDMTNEEFYGYSPENGVVSEYML